MTAPDPGSQASEPRELPRRLGPFDATTIVVGSMIGSGVFLKASSIAQRLPDPRFVALVWAAAGLLSFFGALILAELGALSPRSGGLYAALHEAYGPFVAFLFGWSLLAILQTGSIAGMAAGIVDRALGAQVALSTEASRIVAGALIVAFSAMNLVSVRSVAGVQNVLTTAKALGILALIGVAFASSQGSSAHLAPSGPAPEGLALGSAFGLAMIGALWAYDGWVNVSFVAGEIRDPQRNIPRALVTGTAVVALLYVLVNVAFHWVLTVEEVQQASNPARALAVRVVGGTGAILMTALVGISTLGSLNSSVLSGSRVLFAMARDRLFFRSVGAMHPRFQTPHVAILLQCAWALMLLSRWKTFDALTDNVVFVYWIFYGLGAGAALISRRRHPDAPRPFVVPGGAFVPAAFMVGTIFLCGNALVDSLVTGHPAVKEAFALLALGAVAYPFCRR